MSSQHNQTPTQTAAEWSVKVDAQDIDGSETKLAISADKQASDRVAKRLDVVSVRNLKADLILERVSSGHIVKVAGQLNAEVTQNCVVTLEPVETNIQNDVEGYFTNPEDTVSFSAARKKLKQKKEKGEMPIMEEWEDPEDMEEGMIDVGELVVQHLSLALEPFPHKQGVEFEEGDDGDMLRQPSEVRKNPFVALKYWSDKEDH